MGTPRGTGRDVPPPHTRSSGRSVWLGDVAGMRFGRRAGLGGQDRPVEGGWSGRSGLVVPGRAGASRALPHTFRSVATETLGRSEPSGRGRRHLYGTETYA